MSQDSFVAVRRSPGAPPALWGGFVLFLALVVGISWIARARSPLRTFAAPGVQVIALEDYRFAPKRLVWHAGETITVKLVNAALPPTGHEHEIMIGQAAAMRSGPLGVLPGHGFNVPFFGSTRIEVLDARGVKMIMAPNLKVLGGDLEPMAMGGMAGVDMAMPGEKAAPEGGGDHAEPPAAMDMGGMAMAMQMYVGRWVSAAEREELAKSMDEMRGDNMFLIAPGGSLTIRFTVPEKGGLWEIGCFAGEGSHYIAGMRALVQVVGREGGH